MLAGTGGVAQVERHLSNLSIAQERPAWGTWAGRTMKRQQSALDTYAAHTVLWRLLPPLLLDDATVKKWKPALEQGYRELLQNPAYNVSSNFTK